MIAKHPLTTLVFTSLFVAPPSSSDSKHSYSNLFDDFVVFGDSYTDNGLGTYFSSHDEESPPPGQLAPELSDV